MRDSIHTERLTLRRWHRDDAPMLLSAIDASLDDLRRFTPWVIPDAPPLPTLSARLGMFTDQFDTGEAWIYGIFDTDQTRVIGQVGLYARIGAGALELGYFVRTDAAGNGFATEAARALIEAAFSDTSVARIEIRCDADNEGSISIARRLSFTHRETIAEHDGGRLMVWEKRRATSAAGISRAVPMRA